MDSGDEKVISLIVDILLETFDLVHDECLFSGVDCVDSGVEGDKSYTKDSGEAAEFVHLLV